MIKKSESILIPVSAEMQRELICKLRCIDGNMLIRTNILFSDGTSPQLYETIQVLCNPQNRETRLSQVYRLAEMTEIPVIYYLPQEDSVQTCYVLNTKNQEMHLLENTCCVVTAKAEDVGHMPAMLLGYYRSIHPKVVEIAKLDIIRFHEIDKMENESNGTS